MALSGDRVFIGTEASNSDQATLSSYNVDSVGSLIALDADNGRLLWRKDLPSWLHGDPVIAGASVIVTFGRLPLDTKGGISAFDQHDGHPLWSYTTRTSMMPGGLLDRRHNRFFAASAEGLMFALDATTGQLVNVWPLLGGVSMSAPHIDDDGNIYINAGTRTIAFDPQTIQTRWSKNSWPPLDIFGDVAVAIDSASVYATGTSFIGLRSAWNALPWRAFVPLAWSMYRQLGWDAHTRWFCQQWLVAIDKTTGREQWRRPLGVGSDPGRNHSGTPVVTGSSVVVSSPASHTMWSFARATGTVYWSMRLDATHKGPVTAVGRSVWFGDSKRHLHAVDLATGRSVGTCLLTGEATVFAPMLVGQTLFIGTKDGRFSAIPVDELQRRMNSPTPQPCDS